MQKITKILVETEGILGNEGAPTTAADLNRIANALEQIAASLEKMTGNHENRPVPVVELTKSKVTAKLPKKTNTPSSTKHPINGIPGKIETPQIVLQPKVLEDFISARLATILLPKKQAFTPERNLELDKIALHLGKNFVECKELYQAVKNDKNGSIIYSLSGATPKKNSLVQKLCKLLKKAELLENFDYLGSPVFQLKFNLINISRHTKNFVEGKWLERFLRQEVQRLIRTLPLKLEYEFLPNLQLQLKKQVEGETITWGVELDLLFSVGTHIFCIEAKTTAKTKQLEKYLEKIEALGLAKQNCLIVTAENSEEERQQLADSFKEISIVGLENFEAALTTMVKTACGI